MIKLNILNMRGFLQTVNECGGAVHVLQSDNKVDINKQYEIQNKLLQEYRENKDSLKLSLDIPDSSDFMRIIFFSVGDC